MPGQPHVLIAGAGIAGPALAVLLNRNDFRTTIVERSPSIRREGQQVDLVGPGIEAARFMGVEKSIRARTVHDDGLKIVDSNDRTIGAFPVTDNVNSPVREIEIIRGDMADILFRATRDETEYIFGDRITELNEQADCISVTFASGRTGEYDLVVAADGVGSRTREIAFGKPKEAYIKAFPGFTGTFVVPWQPSDGTWSRLLTAAGRNVFLRPDKARGNTGAYLVRVNDREYGLVVGQPPEQQKAAIKHIFSGMGWEVPRLLDAIDDSDTFYVFQIAQVKMEKWSQGRVVMLGDAGYSPSGVTGLGTTTAFVGAYTLAGSLVTYRDDLQAGIAAYERDLRPFVEKAQVLLPGVPYIANPQTELGIQALNLAARVGSFVLQSGLIAAITWLLKPVTYIGRKSGIAKAVFGGSAGDEKLHVYEKLRGFKADEEVNPDT